MMWFLITAIMSVLMTSTGAHGDDEQVIPLLKRHEIQVLLKAGFTAKDVAGRSGVSLDTVRRVRREAPVECSNDRERSKERRIGRPSKVAEYGDMVRSWLVSEPDLPTQELLRRAMEKGYAGRKTAFYTLVAGVRPPRSAPIVRFEGLPGEFSQHDFGQVDVRYVDGSKERIHFFASRLKYSRFAVVTLVEDERVETLVRCLARDFVAFGGLPLMAVFDRPRTIVKKGGKGRAVEEFNSTFAQAVVDLGVGVEMCAPRSGNQKGSVERLVGWVKSSFFKPRKFLDRGDLVAKLAAWLLEVNTQTASRATGVIPETRRQEELARLRPIKLPPEKLALRIPAFVGPTAEIVFDGVTYSMPPQATHVPATIFLYEDRLQIVAGRFEVEHRRRTKDDPPAPLPEHRAAMVAAVHGARAKLYAKREQLLDLGQDALALLTDITHREPRRAAHRVDELYVLLEELGDDALRNAITQALHANECSVAGVRRAASSGARRSDGSSHHSGAAQPRGEPAVQATLPLHRAEPKRGAS